MRVTRDTTWRTERILETEFTLLEPIPRLVEEIAIRTGLSRAKIKDAMNKGAVWITRKHKTSRVRRATASAHAGDRIGVYFNEEILSTKPPEPRQLQGGKRYSVWYKPAGLMSSGTRFGDHCAINRWIERHTDQRVWLVHRLDRFASGIMVIAHSREAAAFLSRQFQERSTTKIYKAIVEGLLTSEVTIDEPVDGKPALSMIRPLITDARGLSLVSVTIESGRKHQIRRHLAGLGFPVAGDHQYGTGRFPEMQLTAVELGFECPETRRPVQFQLDASLHPRLDKLLGSLSEI